MSKKEKKTKTPLITKDIPDLIEPDDNEENENNNSHLLYYLSQQMQLVLTSNKQIK